MDNQLVMPSLEVTEIGKGAAHNALNIMSVAYGSFKRDDAIDLCLGFMLGMLDVLTERVGVHAAIELNASVIESLGTLRFTEAGEPN